MKTELQEMVAEAKVARSIVGKLCSEGRYPKMSIPLQESDEDRVLCRVCESVTKLVGMIESRDAEHAAFTAEACKVVAEEWKAIHDKEVAEIHAQYAPVVEALEATPALRMQNGPHKGLMRLELFLDESALAAIKEVKG